MMPLAIDLYAGLGGWTDGLLAEGYDVVGFDIERHEYGDQKYPAQLVLQDVLTIHGSQFRNAALIVASPPCQRYSWMAMPFSRGKREAKWQRWERDSPFGNFRLNDLFDACFRIQREASEAAGHHIPMVVENVKGAQPWVGRAKANFGSFYLWGDVAMVGKRVVCGMQFGSGTQPMKAGRMKSRIPATGKRFDERVANTPDEAHALHYRMPDDARKVPGFNFHEHEKTGKPGRSFQSAAVEGTKGIRMDGAYRPDQHGRNTSSGSHARKAASAQIAKIPLELSRYIARVYRPENTACNRVHIADTLSA